MSKFKQVGFYFTAKSCYISYRLNTNRSEFHRVGATTERTLVLTFVLTLGTKRRLNINTLFF